MPQRLALIAAAAAATIVLAVGLAAAGFVPVARPGEPAVAAFDSATITTEAAPEPEVVYVKPAPSPKTVVVQKPSKAATSSKSSTTPTRVVRNVRRESDDRYEGREWDDDERGEREDD